MVRQIRGTPCETDCKRNVARLADGRAKAKATSKKTSLTGRNKVEGRKSFLELYPPFPKIVSGILARHFGKLMLEKGGRILSRTLADKLQRNQNEAAEVRGNWQSVARRESK